MNRLSEEAVKARAAKCESYTKFISDHGGSYNHARNHGYLKDIKAIFDNVSERAFKAFLERGQKAFGDFYDYSKVVWVRATDNVEIVCPNHGSFFQLPNNHGKSGCPKCAAGRKSKPEAALADFIAQYTPVVTNTRAVVSGIEIDVFLPDYNIGFEFNGLYWHSSGSDTPRDYHQTKTDLANEAGVRLIHIWEDEWRDNRVWVESFIKNLLGKSRKIGARQTRIATPSNADAKAFHSEHHLQGHRAGEHYGIYLKDELVAVATTAKTNKGELELARWTVKNGLIIQGGLSKICKAIDKPMITFCDTAKHDGAGFEKAGFQLVSEGSITYWYTDSTDRFNRIGFQKHKLEAKNAKGNTEKEMAASLGYHQIGGCNQKKYALGLDTVVSLPIDEAKEARLKAHQAKKTQRAFTDSDLIEIAAQFNGISALQAEDASAYNAIRSRGLQEVALDHMERAHREWTDERVLVELEKYDNIDQVRNADNGLFIQAYRRGLTGGMVKFDANTQSKRRIAKGAVKAVEDMRAAGLEPLEDYPGTKHPWKSKCTSCGDIVAPRLGGIRAGQGGCVPCGYANRA